MGEGETRPRTWGCWWSCSEGTTAPNAGLLAAFVLCVASVTICMGSGLGCAGASIPEQTPHGWAVPEARQAQLRAFEASLPHIAEGAEGIVLISASGDLTDHLERVLQGGRSGIRAVLGTLQAAAVELDGEAALHVAGWTHPPYFGLHMHPVVRTEELEEQLHAALLGSGDVAVDEVDRFGQRWTRVRLAEAPAGPAIHRELLLALDRGALRLVLDATFDPSPVLDVSLAMLGEAEDSAEFIDAFTLLDGVVAPFLGPDAGAERAVTRWAAGLPPRGMSPALAEVLDALPVEAAGAGEWRSLVAATARARDTLLVVEELELTLELLAETRPDQWADRIDGALEEGFFHCEGPLLRAADAVELRTHDGDGWSVLHVERRSMPAEAEIYALTWPDAVPGLAAMTTTMSDAWLERLLSMPEEFWRCLQQQGSPLQGALVARGLGLAPASLPLAVDWYAAFPYTVPGGPAPRTFIGRMLRDGMFRLDDDAGLVVALIAPAPQPAEVEAFGSMVGAPAELGEPEEGAGALMLGTARLSWHLLPPRPDGTALDEALRLWVLETRPGAVPLDDVLPDWRPSSEHAQLRLARHVEMPALFEPLLSPLARAGLTTLAGTLSHQMASILRDVPPGHELVVTTVDDGSWAGFIQTLHPARQPLTRHADRQAESTPLGEELAGHLAVGRGMGTSHLLTRLLDALPEDHTRRTDAPRLVRLVVADHVSALGWPGEPVQNLVLGNLIEAPSFSLSVSGQLAVEATSGEEAGLPARHVLDARMPVLLSPHGVGTPAQLELRTPDGVPASEPFLLVSMDGAPFAYGGLLLDLFGFPGGARGVALIVDEPTTLHLHCLSGCATPVLLEMVFEQGPE